MHQQPSSSYELAMRDFQRARQSAVLRQTLARLRGEPSDLLDYETVAQQLQPIEEPVQRGLQEIPLEKIVGSVGRYRDFTRGFLPTSQADSNRWANVKAAITNMEGLPPIEVYQLGDAYFVLDGNHRVSVARKLGTETISAYVTEVQTRVPLAAADDPNEVICKARYADFLTVTNLDKTTLDKNALDKSALNESALNESALNTSSGELDLLMTISGQYRVLLKQIDAVHQQALQDWNQGASRAPCPTLQECALVWYNTVYLPVIQIIRKLGVMRRFPKRTEADIYVLLSEERDELEAALGWHLDLAETVPTLVESAQPSKAKVGGWRNRQLAMERTQRLFSDLLVLFEGIDEDWALLEAAIDLATADHDRILGLCIVNSPDQIERTRIREMEARFHRRCGSAGLVGEFAVEVAATASESAEVVLQRAAWSDLLFINLTHPPESTVLDRLRSFWGPVITRCPRPLLVAPHAYFKGMGHMLLAYDGSPKAEEALFVATYNASRWGHQLSVLTVETPHTKGDALARAQTYLEAHGIDHAEYLLRQAPIGPAILDIAAEKQVNTIIMGGFGARPRMRLLRGSSVEYVLQHTTEQAVLICQ